eukprot:15170308-Alexandrium_andersonii.AAC.1
MGATDVAPLMSPAGRDEPSPRRGRIARPWSRSAVRARARPRRRDGVSPDSDKSLPGHHRPREGGM